MQEGSESNIFTFQEAMEIEQEAHRQHQQRKKELEQKQEDKRRRMGLLVGGERALTREEQEARVYAFMYGTVYILSERFTKIVLYHHRSYKPNESDLEDEDDDDDADDDPSTYFDDDQDDGRKGQDIIEPDYGDISEVIRIDESRIPGNYFFEREGE